MPSKEIERKFLILKDSLDIPGLIPLAIIHQTYISLQDPEQRVRLWEPFDGSPIMYFYTEKSGSGMVRNENEYEIDFLTYKNYTQGKLPLIKTRYKIESIDEGEAILDIYNNLDYKLKVLEIEFPVEEEALVFIPPDWFGPEITGTKLYKNSTLWLKIQERR